MKSESLTFLFGLLVATAFVGFTAGCSHSETKIPQDASSLTDQTAAEMAFAKAHGSVWLSTNAVSSLTGLTVDFQDGLFSEGSARACELWVQDVRRKGGDLLLSGVCLSPFADLEIEITTNMMTAIRTAGGKNGFVRIAFEVKSFNRIVENSSDDPSDRYLVRGKALAIEPIPATPTARK